MHLRRLAALALALTVGTITSIGADTEGWTDPFYPYRLRLQLTEPASGRVAVDLPRDRLVAALQPACADWLHIDSVAFENAVLVDPATGARVGGYRLTPVGDPMPVDGGFQRLLADEVTPWATYGNRYPRRGERIQAGDRTFGAMWVECDELTNSGYSQRLTVVPGALYLLQYWTYADPRNMLVQVMDPAKRLFAREHHSYYPALTPRKTWTRQQVLVQPRVAEVELKIPTVFRGRAGVGGIELRQVELSVVADLPNPTQALDLYVVLRGGHRLAEATDELIGDRPPERRVAVTGVTAESLPLNPGGPAAEDAGLRAWTIPPELPLKADLLRRTEPTRGDSPLHVTLCRGEARTVLVAVDGGTPRLRFTQTACDLSLDTRFEQLAEVPVYDGPFPGGTLTERRLDALVPLNFDLTPPSSTGIHVLAVTLRADEEQAPGARTGTLRVAVQTQRPDRAVFELPVSVTVLPVTLKPAHHFGTQFAGVHWLVRYRKGAGPFTEDSTTVAEYCGYSAEKLEPPTAMSLTNLNTNDWRMHQVRGLARKYFHRMIDYQVMPKSPTLYSSFSYDVVERDDGQAPALTNWDFSEYDEAIREFVIGRDMPCFSVYHTNGYQMHKLRLRNGTTYSTRPNDKVAAWKQLPEDQFYQLVGDYFEAFATHLGELGVLERALFVIDESGPDTFETIRRFVLAMKARPAAGRITVTHTMYKPSAWTEADDDGKLLLDGVIDVPAPDNDDHFNRFEPEWNARMRAPTRHWVYYVETEHLALQTAGLSTILTPLKLKAFGAEGWYCWGSCIWSMPYPKTEVVGLKYPSGPVVNPWLNPFYHHGPGMLSFFYPPDPRGPAPEPTDRVIPSYRLALIRDGIQLRALLEVLEAGRDDAGQSVRVDSEKLAQAKAHLQRLWAGNPVQWYLSYHAFRQARQLLCDAVLTAP